MPLGRELHGCPAGLGEGKQRGDTLPTTTAKAPGPGDTGSPWGQLDGGCQCSDSPISWQECGPLESEAMVMGVLNEAFDVLVLKFGVQKRIYCNVSTSPASDSPNAASTKRAAAARHHQRQWLSWCLSVPDLQLAELCPSQASWRGGSLHGVSPPSLSLRQV